MSDVHTKETRSFNMSRIQAKNTKPELIVRQFLHKKGYRYRLHVKDLPGKPDLVFPKLRTIIQVNGCFWHGHEGCKYFSIPATRKDWWESKIQRTIMKDAENLEILTDLGWRVITIWECQLKGVRKASTLFDLAKTLEN
ncbi:very short patch repair endonuclease [Fulvivirga sedimenti]|uniref:Very short patch repair endonuclease n=1 Tax=Fulvivirga sedimenti TaxID=2879465 RepID=A0A9X1HQX5_9BACT|nr:very short patch repair endonuclease [Fulvivirga sedimenti]MCA6075595.1 very short patch repair endonuclease [Fulvivirga sedimenti]